MQTLIYKIQRQPFYKHFYRVYVYNTYFYFYSLLFIGNRFLDLLFDIFVIHKLLSSICFTSKAPSTRIRIFLNPQLFLSGYGYRPHAYGEFASKSGNFLIRSPEWKFFNPITFWIRVDGRIRIFSDTMTSQNWRQCLPRKFKYGRRSKPKSFCAP